MVHSLTKYIGGHGSSLGGIVIDSGKFPWQQHADRFAVLNTLDPSYHGVNYSEHFGCGAAFIARLYWTETPDECFRFVPDFISLLYIYS